MTEPTSPSATITLDERDCPLCGGRGDTAPYAGRNLVAGCQTCAGTGKVGLPCTACGAEGTSAWMKKHRVNVHQLPPDPPDAANHLAVFEELCRGHDLTYSMSDDHRAWQRGTASYDRVLHYARSYLQPADAQRIWNAEVDRKLTEAIRHLYHAPADWPPPKT